MDKPISHPLNFSIWKFIIPAVSCLFGIWVIVVIPLGLRLELLPGDFGDTRLNNFLLEHFFRWISGLEKSFWNADFFYPYPYTIAFSENFLGSGLFYSLFRWIGFDRETAFQGWYIWGYLLNYAAAVYVLSRLKFNPLGVATGAFFFTFGMPVLAKENHVQLLYRFGVPLACLCLWRMFEKQKFQTLIGLFFWTVWQFYLSIYTGVFLAYLLFAMAVLLPFFKQDQSFFGLFNFWPSLIKTTWNHAASRERLIASLSAALLFFALVTLLWPYYQVTKLYGFTRNWEEVSSMLLNWRTFITADHSLIWGPVTRLIKNYPMRSEHNMFIGLPAVICIMISLAWHRRLHNKKVVFLHLFATILLIFFTIKVRGFSLYSIIWPIPGLGSIRAISRIFLILMWPITICISYTITQMLDRRNKHHILLTMIAYVLVLGLMIEPVFMKHSTFNKLDAQKRINSYLNQIPTSIPDQPILVLANNGEELPLITDIDGMLLAQRLGWPIMNGYSGSNPPGYGSTKSCRNIQQRFLAYMNFAGISSDSYYLEMINRVVPLGFEDCGPMLKVRKPIFFTGPLPQELLEGITMNIVSLQKVDSIIRVEVMITNRSSVYLPAYSSTNNPVRLSWRLVNMDTGQYLTGFDARQDLYDDVYPGENAKLSIDVIPPEQTGQYQLEVTAVQEQVAWFYDQGLPVVKSRQVILVDAQNILTITTPVP